MIVKKNTYLHIDFEFFAISLFLRFTLIERDRQLRQS